MPTNILHFTRPVAPINEIELYAWIAQADDGDVLEYHRGALAIDRDKVISKLDEAECERIGQLADGAFRASEQELVHLVQRRLGPDCFSYLAIARPKLRQERVSLCQLLTQEAA